MTEAISDDREIQPSRNVAFAKRAISGYSPPSGMPFTTDKIAHFLVAMITKAPKVLFSYNLVYQAVNGLSRTPGAKDKSVLQLARSMSSVREKLLRQHNRDLKTVRGVGIRASVDGEDRVQVHDDYKAKLGRMYDKTTHHAGTIDPATIANAKSRAQFTESRRTLSSLSEHMCKLTKFVLPPKFEDIKKP